MEQKVMNEILERIVRIETKIDNYNDIRERADKALNLAENNKDKISEIRDSLKWAWRTIGAALISGSIGIIFYYIKTGAIK